MKKLVVAMALAGASMAVMTTANAGFHLNTTDARFYAGLDYSHVSGLAGVEDFGSEFVKNHVSTLGVVGGVQFSDSIGLEASWSTNVENPLKVDGFKLDYQQVTLGVTGQYPLAENIYAKALLGVAWQEVDVKTPYGKFGDSEGATFHGKVGVGYQVDANSVVEASYGRIQGYDGLNTLSVQYKYIF